MTHLLTRLFGDGGLPPRRDDPFADARIAAMSPADLADLPLPAPGPSQLLKGQLRRAARNCPA